MLVLRKVEQHCNALSHAVTTTKDDDDKDVNEIQILMIRLHYVSYIFYFHFFTLPSPCHSLSLKVKSISLLRPLSPSLSRVLCILRPHLMVLIRRWLHSSNYLPNTTMKWWSNVQKYHSAPQDKSARTRVKMLPILPCLALCHTSLAWVVIVVVDEVV